MKISKTYRMSVTAAAFVAVAVGTWMLVGCSKQLAGNETGTPVEVALPALVIEPVQTTILASAVGSPDADPTEAAPNNDIFSVQMLNPAATQKADTTPTKAATALSNVWVLQFDGAGTTRTCAYVGTVKAGSNILATLESGEGYTMWIVANGPENGAFTTSNPATLADFESQMLYTAKTTDETKIPLCGKIENITVLKNGQLLVGNNNAVAPSVILKRAQAKIDILLEYTVSGATLDGVWLYNVPKGAVYGITDPDANNIPAAEENNFLYTEGFADGEAPAATAGAGTVTYTWFLGDNRRGEVPSILWEKDKSTDKAPQWAAYARIKSHEDAAPDKYIFHDVLLGVNKTTDFNVLRNWNYIYRVRIGGTLAQQKALVGVDSRVTAGVLPAISSASVTPDPTLIDRNGGEYTITLNGAWSGGDIPVRIWDGQTALAQGNVTYLPESKGGSIQLTIPANNAEILRSLAFQYQWFGNWVTIKSGQQQGRQVDFGANFILQSPDPNKTMNWQDAINYCKSLGDGWRLPTQNELMLLWCIYPTLSDDELFNNNTYGENADSYWSCTNYSGNPANEAWFAMFSGGDILYPSINREHNFKVKTYSLFTRCVKSKPVEEIDQRYPYITTASDGGTIIVLRDEKGGFLENTLYPEPLTQTLTGHSETSNNRMSRRFRIQKGAGSAGNWSTVISYCDNLDEEGFTDWRVPSQRELQIIWMLGGNDNAPNGDQNDSGVGGISVPISTSYIYQLDGFNQFGDNAYYSAIMRTSPNVNPNVQDFSIGYTGSFPNSKTYSIRCIRDEW